MLKRIARKNTPHPKEQFAMQVEEGVPNKDMRRGEPGAQSIRKNEG